MRYNGISSKHYSQKKLIADYNTRVDYTCHVENLAYYIKKVGAIFYGLLPHTPQKKPVAFFQPRLMKFSFRILSKSSNFFFFFAFLLSHHYFLTKLFCIFRE